MTDTKMLAATVLVGLLIAGLAWEHHAGTVAQRERDAATAKARADSVHADSVVKAALDTANAGLARATAAHHESLAQQGKAQQAAGTAKALGDSLGKLKAVDSAAFVRYRAVRDSEAAALRLALHADSLQAIALFDVIHSDTLALKALHVQLDSVNAKYAKLAAEPRRSRCAPSVGGGGLLGWHVAGLGLIAGFTCQL